MTELTLSIFDPNTLLPHRAGVAGLALALSSLSSTDAPLQWKIAEDFVTLSWECKDQDSIQWLLKQTYRSDQGYLEAPSLKLDEQGRYIFSEGVMSTFLQYQKQRKRADQAIMLNFLVEEDKPEIKVSYRPILDCYYTRDFQKLFDSKGALKKKIAIKSHHLPGLIECFVNGAYAESPSRFLALLFLPLACGYYQLPGYRSALVIPEVRNIKEWVKLRQKISGRTYKSFRSSSAGESALSFLLREKLADDSSLFRIDYCEVYRLGSKPWDGNQLYLKQDVHRIQASDRVLGLYKVASRNLAPKVKSKQDGSGVWLAESKALAWISDNLVTNKSWYSGFFKFRKANTIYPEDRRGIIVMTEHLNMDEKVLFDAVQGAFRKYRGREIKQAQRQGRSPDWEKITSKVIYRLQRPSTQQEFATALVDFLSQYRSKAALSSGPQVFWWLHQEANWRKARDLTLLAIATYQGQSQEEQAAIEQEVEQDSFDDDETPNVL